MDGKEPKDGTDAGIAPFSVAAGNAEQIGAPEPRLSIVPSGNTFWTLPPGPRCREPEIEAIFIDEPTGREFSAGPGDEPGIEAILVEDPGFPDLLRVLGRISESCDRVSRTRSSFGGPSPSTFRSDLPNSFSLGPVAQIDLRDFEAESEPEIYARVAVQPRPEEVPVRVDAGRSETVDQHEDVTVVISVVTIAALAWLIFRRPRR